MIAAKIQPFGLEATISIRGKIIDFARPRVMGIINCEDRSFYRANTAASVDAALRLAGTHLRGGAFFLDIGAVSTKPGSPISNPREEWERLKPVLKAIRKEFPEVYVSVDTYHSFVARNAVSEGVDIINDISAGSIDSELIPFVIESNTSYILMHMQGLPATMQTAPEYSDVQGEVLSFLAEKVNYLRSNGVSNIIIDPGFGFGKSVEHNFSILKHLNEYKQFGAPVLAGLSRKSMITRTLSLGPEEALNGTTALNMIALQNGADILRVHDAKEASEAIRLFTFAKMAP